MFNHPDDVRRILIANHRNYTKGVGFDRIKILLGNGIIVSEGEFWKRQRRMMQPTFHRRMLGAVRSHHRHAPTTGCWPTGRHKCARGEPVNVTDDMSTMTLEIVLRRHLRRRPRSHGAPRRGDNPFAVLTEESARDLRFAYRFRKLAGHDRRSAWRSRRAAGARPPAIIPTTSRCC